MRTKRTAFAVINARSLAPKAASLAENFLERKWTFAAITETWLIDDAVCDATKQELKYAHGTELLHVNRRATNGRNTGGGVAIAYKRSLASFKYFPIRRGGCEVIAAKGKLVNVSTPLYVITAYLPPGMRKRQLNVYIDVIRDAITKIKLQEQKQTIILCSVINNYDLAPALQDFLDIDEAASPPTRGVERLDLIFSNCTADLDPPAALPPLESEAGSTSDHLILACNLQQ